jgi:hypothetical protein
MQNRTTVPKGAIQIVAHVIANPQGKAIPAGTLDCFTLRVRNDGAYYGHRHYKELRGAKQNNPAYPYGWLTVKISGRCPDASGNGLSVRLCMENLCHAHC